MDLVDNMACDLNQQNFISLLQNPFFSKLMPFWNNFLDHFHHNNGDISAYWMSYIDMVENILLAFCMLLVKVIFVVMDSLQKLL